MTNQFSTATILSVFVLITVLIPVLHSSKAPVRMSTPSGYHSRASAITAVGGGNEDHHRRGINESNLSQKNNLYSRRQSDIVKSNQNSNSNNNNNNNIVMEGTLQGTLLKAQMTEEENRHYKNYLDTKNMGVKSYKRRYPAKKPRRHYYANQELVNNINIRPDRYQYSKDLKKHKYRHHPVEFPKQNLESHVSQKTTTLTMAKTIHPTVESVPKQDDVSDSDSSFSNLSKQTDFDLSELSNSSMDNESLSWNSSETKKSNYSRCPTCRMRDGDRQYRIERLKQSILSSLHMTAPPNASQLAMPKVPAMAKYYQIDSDMMNDSPYSKRTNKDDDYTIRTERVFTKARQPPAQVQLNITDSLYFAPPIKLYTSKIKTAYFWFYIRKKEIRRPYVHLTIERILAESVPENRLVTKTVFSKKLMRNSAFGWKRIDLRNVLRRWVTHPMSNHGLQIRALDDQGNNLVVLTPSPEVDRGYEPWLDTKVIEQKSNSRHRRSHALSCTDNSTESRCCRYPLYITFAEFGWEWIIAPSRVKADYCSGECEMTMQNVSPIGWIHQQAEVSSTSGSCCSPSELAPMSLLYFDDDYNVLYQILQDMKVEECGCT